MEDEFLRQRTFTTKQPAASLKITVRSVRKWLWVELPK